MDEGEEERTPEARWVMHGICQVSVGAGSVIASEMGQVGYEEGGKSEAATEDECADDAAAMPEEGSKPPEAEESGQDVLAGMPETPQLESVLYCI